MTPIKYKTYNNGTTRFVYNAKEKARWNRLGRKHGDVGFLLKSRKDSIYTYECYGTIENPSTNKSNLMVCHNEMFDGPERTNDEILIPPKPLFNNKNETSKFIVIDFSKPSK